MAANLFEQNVEKLLIVLGIRFLYRNPTYRCKVPEISFDSALHQRGETVRVVRSEKSNPRAAFGSFAGIILVGENHRTGIPGEFRNG